VQRRGLPASGRGEKVAFEEVIRGGCENCDTASEGVGGGVCLVVDFGVGRGEGQVRERI